MLTNRMNLYIFGEEKSNESNPPADTGSKGGYTYEQAEEIANARAEKATRSALASYFRQNGLNEDEITKAIADFKAKQEANKPNISAIEKERDDARKELEELKQTGLLRDKGVKADDIDYVMFKVSKMVDDKTDFKKALDKFLKENPRFTGTGYRVSTSTSSADNNTGNNSINDRIRMAMRR